MKYDLKKLKWKTLTVQIRLKHFNKWFLVDLLSKHLSYCCETYETDKTMWEGEKQILILVCIISTFCLPFPTTLNLKNQCFLVMPVFRILLKSSISLLDRPLSPNIQSVLFCFIKHYVLLLSLKITLVKISVFWDITLLKGVSDLSVFEYWCMLPIFKKFRAFPIICAVLK